MNDSVCSSTKAERFVSYSYDFKNSGWFRTIKKAKDKISIVPTYNPDYIIHSNKYVITYARNIYDNIHFSTPDDIGTVMVNFNVANFKNALNEFDDMKGYVLVLDKNGFVIFDSIGKYTAKTFPYFNRLISGRASINLGGECIVEVKNDPSSKFIIALITPKKEVLKETTVIKNQIYLVLIFIMILSIILTILWARFFSTRVKKIITSMKSVEKGIFNNNIEVKGEDEIDQIARSFNSMCYKLNNYINAVYVSHIKQKNAELNALQTQINPHFLFNTLESLRMKAVINNDNEVGDMAYNLSNLFKWVVKNRNTIITVEEELEYLQYYLSLQKDRFGNRLEYILEIDEGILDFEIIKFTLQPLIENAVQHGIEKKVEGGSIIVKGYRTDDNLVFDIIDDGVGIDGETMETLNKELSSDYDSHPEGIGLKNVHDRIRIIYGDEYGIKIEKPEHGTIVRIVIPAKKHLG
jgi:two-component system sensor histidine kinase YesM